jgi:hypothetical protein
MNSEENLRRFLQDRFNAEEPLPGEAEWEQTRRYLDARRRASRRRFAGLSLLALIPVAVVLLWPRTDAGEDVIGMRRPVTQETLQVPSSGIPAPAVNAEQIAPDEHKAASHISHEAENADAVQSPPAIRNTASRSVNPAQTEVVTPGVIESANEATRTEKDNSTLNGQIVLPDRMPALQESKATASVTVPMFGDSVYKSRETETAGHDTETMPEPLTNITVSEISAGQGLAVTDMTIRTDAEPALANTISVVQAIQEPVLSKPDSLATGASNARPQAREGIFYELGGGWLYGWSTAESRDARGFTPIAGINYATRLEQRSAVSFGVQYAMVPGLSGSSRTSRVTSFRFGEESRITVITPITLHYLVVPLRFHYALGNGFTAGGGMNLGYLLNVDARVTTYDEKPGYAGNYETIQLSGYRDGFLWYDSQVAVFFRKDLCRNFGVHTEVFYGLSDVKQDEFFRQTSVNRNSGLKLTFIYYPSTRPGK